MTVTPARLLAVCGRIILPFEVERAVRAWRLAQPDKPSRQEAIARLTLQGVNDEDRAVLGLG